MFQPSIQLDPLNSPHPIPWGWVMATLSAIAPGEPGQQHYYRSPSLLSPDNQYAAYSRIQMQVESEFYRSCVSSILFLENLLTGDLQAITPTSPLAENPFLAGNSEIIGRISIVIPVSWTETGDRLLARVFESLFGSDIASDYAVIVDRRQNQISTVAPTLIPYTTAILLGWSQSHPERVLFRAGNLGEDDWRLWAVAADGGIIQAEGDRPVTFGQVSSNVWMGPQVQQS